MSVNSALPSLDAVGDGHEGIRRLRRRDREHEPFQASGARRAPQRRRCRSFGGNDGRLDDADRLDRGEQQSVAWGLDFERRALSGFSFSARGSTNFSSIAQAPWGFGPPLRLAFFVFFPKTPSGPQADGTAQLPASIPARQAQGGRSAPCESAAAGIARRSVERQRRTGRSARNPSFPSPKPCFPPLSLESHYFRRYIAS